MNFILKDAIADWDAEVAAEATRLIRQGTPPYDAIEQAVKNVSNRRQHESGITPKRKDSHHGK